MYTKYSSFIILSSKKRVNLIKSINSNKNNLREKAYNTIKRAIFLAELKPGNLISEISLAKQLSMSRTPVREAIKKLEYEGLVNSIPGVGTFVIQLSSKDIREIYFLRITLEIAALELVINNINIEEIITLESEFKSIEPKLSHIDEEVKMQLFKLDKSLHRLIIDSVQSKKFSEVIDLINIQIEMTRIISAVHPGRLKQSFREHIDILNAIKKRDLESAKDCLKRHLINVRENTLEINENIEIYLGRNY